jgi:PKD repeat protein
MISKEKVTNLCLLTLFASTFSAQVMANDKPNKLKKFNELILENNITNNVHAEHNCGADHNGQDWNKLQNEFIQQIKSTKAKRSRLSRSMTTAMKTATVSAVEGSVALDGRYYIPIVLHVYGEAYNCTDDADKCLTDDKINDALRKLNDDFQGLSVDTPEISPQFAAIRENLNIEFVLAQKDPDGNATNGIVRYDREQAGYGNNDEETRTKIASDAWDNFKYMNVYLMHDLHADDVGNNSGIAWYPDLSMSTAGTSRVVYNGHYTGLNTSENFRSVLTHEFGHWLNLIHTFETKTCSITNEAFCATTGDKDCDTPQMALPSQMQNNAMNCLGQPTNTENFMHYTDNYAMFTNDQVKRMTAALHGPSRSTLWSNDNLIATGLELLTSDSERAWDGLSGLDVEPDGLVLESFENISGPLDGIETFEINLPPSAANILFHLDGHTADPDMYISKGMAPTTDGEGNWVADYISFNSPGTAESVSIDIPDFNQPYYASIHGFTEFEGSRLRVIQGNDPFLNEGDRRYTLLKVENLKANKLDASWENRPGKTHNFQFTVPDDASRVVVVIPAGYHGPVMASGVPNFNGDLDLHVSRNGEVSLDTYDCRPFSWKGIAEYCEFDGGGTYNVMIDPFKTYTDATLHVYYETADTGNQLPYANTNGNKYEEAVGHAIEFTGNGSNDPDGDIVSYLWDFGDGTQSSDKSVAHTYQSTGEYDVMLMVTDSSGESTTASTQAIITQNSPFDAELCDDCTRFYLTDDIQLSATEGDTPSSYYFEVPDAASLVTFELVNGYNGDPDIHVSQHKEVSLETFDCRPWESPGQTELCQFTEGGIFNVMLDPYHNYDSVRFKAYYDIRDDADHSAPNKFPVANAGGEYTGRDGHAIRFSGLQSTDVDGSITEYVWNFGNGVTQTGATVDYIFPSAGAYSVTYPVTLTVTDNKGGTNSQTASVVVLPIGDLDGDGDVDSDDIRDLSLAIDQNQPLDDSFDINNDGVIDSADSRALRDLCSYERCSSIKPAPQAPVAVASILNNNVQVNMDVVFNSADSTDQYGHIMAYSWSFGDGTTSDLANPSHQYAQPGIYDAVLTVTDNDDMMASSTIQVNISHPLLQDACIDTPADDSRDLLPSVAKCVGAKKIFSFNRLDKHTTVAITLINAPEDSQIYFRDGGWPKINTNEYSVKSTAEGDQQCVLYKIPADSSNWGYIQLSEVSEGATIVMDYDVASCRPLSEAQPVGNTLQNDVVRLVSGVTRGESIYTLEVPVGATNLSFNTSGGTGDVDMHVKFGSEATKSDYDCRPWKVGSKETCNISNVQAGTYYIMLLGYNDFNDVNLVASFTP